MAFRPGEDLYYITYEMVPTPGGQGVPSMPMGFTYDADPDWKGGERTASTREEIRTGRRTSTLRTEDEISAAQRQNRAYEKGKVYSVGDGTYVRIKSISKFNPATLTSEQWAKISDTERWSVDYLVGKYGSSEVKAELKAGPTSAAPETDSAVPDTGRGRVIYVDDLYTVPDGEIAVWGANMFNADTGTATPGAGQAEAAAGRTGWIGIPTKRDPSTFLTDDDLTKSDFSKLMDTQLKKIEAALASGRDVYFPSKGIGTNRAKLKSSAPAIWERLNSRLKELGITNVAPASKTTARRPTKPINATRPTRDYGPIEAEATAGKSTPTNVDAVVAVGKLLGNGKVDGGTGWAVEGALLRGVPVYVYDEISNRWYTATEVQRSAGGWKAVDGPPTDVESIAGVGTRQPTESGSAEIQAYVQSLDPSVEIHSGGAQGSDTAFETTHAAQGGVVVSHSWEGHSRYSKAGGVLLHSPEDLASVDAEVRAIARSLGRPFGPQMRGEEYTMNLIRRNMYQIAPGRDIGIAPRERSTLSLSTSREAAAAAKEESKRKRGFPTENPWDIPNNVYSANKRNGFLAALTNRTSDLPRTAKGGASSSLEHGNIKNRYPVVFEGKVYPSSEHAYLALSPEAGKPDTVSPEEIDLMSRIIAEKLRQNPRLLERVQQNMAAVGEGTTPQQWVELLVHWTQAAARWEGNGLESPFLQALAKGAEAAIANPESAEETRLIKWIQDPKNQVNLPKQGAVNIPPNEFGDITVQPATGADNVKVGAAGPEMDTPEGFTVKLLEEFKTMRETAARSSTMGSKMQGFDGLSTLQKINLYRTLGASGAYGFKFDSLNQEPVPGIDPRRTVRGRINALAAKMGITLPPELDFKPGKPIIGDKKTVAQVMADAFMAIRYMNTVESSGNVRFSGETRAEMAALMLELSRTLHEIGDPYSLAMIKGLSKTMSSGEYTGLTSKAKEAEALGVDMSAAEAAPPLYGRRTQAKLRQLASAQVGLVPQSSPRAGEPKMYRSLDLDLLPIPVKSKKKTVAVARAGDSRGIPSITKDNAIYDLQRVVDEVGIWDVANGGGDDLASIDLDGFIDGGNTEVFTRTKKSPIADLLGIEEALGVIRQYTSVRKLDDRTDFSLFNYRTGFKYRSRLGKQGVIAGDQQIEAPKVERVKVEKPNLATQAEGLRRRIERVQGAIDAMDRYAAGVAIGAGGGTAEQGAIAPIPELETYRALPSGISGKRLAFLRRQATDALRILNQDLNKVIGSTGTDPISWNTTDFENTYEAELAPKFGEGGAYAEMFGVQAAANVATERVNARGWRGLVIAGEEPVKVKLPKWYLDQKRREYAKWKGVLDEVAAIHGKAYAMAYMTSEEGKALYGIEPDKFDKDFVTLEPGDYVLPAPVATEIASLNQGIITDVEINDLGRSVVNPTSPVDVGVDLNENVAFKLNIRPIVVSKYLVLKNGTVVANRSSETGFIQHRKVYPFRVERTADGGYQIRRLEGYQFEHTDPNQIYGQEAMKETLRQLDVAFSPDGPGFESNQMGNLLNELGTAIAFDGYSALEILAINGDIFPQLEAEIVASITEQTGKFRTNLAPNWSAARAKDMIYNSSMTDAERAAASVSPVPGEAMAAPLAKVGKMQSSVEPAGLMAGAPAYKITEYPDWLVSTVNEKAAHDLSHAQEQLAAAEQSGDQEAINKAKLILEDAQEKFMSDRKITIGTEQGRRRYSGGIIGQTLTRDQAMALASPSTTAIQRAIGGSYTVHDILASPEKFGHTVRTETMDGDSGAMYIIRALTYMLRLSEEAVVQMGYGNRFSKSDMERFGLTEPAIILADKASAIEAARIGGDTFDSIVRESLDSARLAAMALTEAAKGTLRKSWSDSLDPKYHRHEVAPRIETRTPLDEFMYPIYRMLEPATVSVETADAVDKVLQNIASGGPDVMRVSGALGDKATAFYNEFYKPAGLPDPKDLAGRPLPAPEGQDIAARLVAEVSRKLGRDLRVPAIVIPEGDTREFREFVAALYEGIKEENPREILSWEQGQSGFAGLEGMMQITKPDGTVEIVNEAEWRAQAKERKRQRAIDGFDASTGLDEEGQVIEFDLNADEYDSGTIQEDVAPVSGQAIGKAAGMGARFAKTVAVKYASSGNIEEAIRSTLPEFGELPPIGSVEMKMFFRNFWKTLSVDMSGRMQGPAIEQMIRTILETQDGKVKLENARRVWIQPTESATGSFGITITSEGGPAVPETMPKIATIQLNDNGKLDVNTQFLLSYLRGTPNESGKYSGGIDKLAAKTDTSLREIAWGVIREYLNGPATLKAPFDWGTPGPTTVMIRRLVDAIESGTIPSLEIDPPTDTPLNIEGYDPNKKQKQSMSGEDAVDPNDYEMLQDQAMGRDPEDFSGGYIDTDSEIMNLSVKQGKLLGLLQPDQLLPKFSPGLKKIDFGLRTPKGNFGGGLGADVGIMALQGNLTPEGALFSAGINSVNLLTKSPLKAGLIGSAAGLAATAATGGDLGRTMFGIVGSVLGGGLGAFASGGIGTFVGSTAGSLVADELWKGLFGSNEGMRPTIRPIQPDIPTVRIP